MSWRLICNRCPCCTIW